MVEPANEKSQHKLWSLITPVNPASTWGPLIFIFAVSATKEAWDDYNRYLSDKKANEKEVWVVKQGIKKLIQSQDIRVGNIVWLRENDEVPCDLVLIGTSDPQGVCYVEGVIECPGPDKDIRRFDGNLRNETKLGMTRGIPEPKLTAVDAMIDKLTGAIFVFQIVVVIVLGTAGNVWKDTEARKVSLDLVKSLYAKFIDWDYEMIDPETDTPSHATNTAISEDLAQVEYILTDKTGTLTENRMIFRRCCIGGIFYGNETGDALKDVGLLNAITSGSPDVIRFLTVMAVCNTVIPAKSKAGAILYKAQSQDEEALVHAAAQLHMVLVNKNASILEIKFNGSVLQYEILETLEFTSDRKRMSVVVKDCHSGNISLLSKGADEAILPYAHAGQQTRTFVEAVEQYSQLGLRTLCLAWREVEEDEYQEWSLMFKEASSTLIDREWRIAEVCQRLEHDLKVLGVTAIEDRLQDGVPETIETLRKAGINFWMLTGDKQNTAIQIALSCNFISPEPKGQLLSIDGKTEDEVCRSLERVLLTMRITTSEPKDVAFVVDGWALEIALKHYRKAFTELAILSRTAICCRVTPSQKAQLVELLKSCDYRTLAIGDGGNDVRMIQKADIGVGISGREGLQAARAADYSIGSLSGTSLFNSVSLMAYNVFYTSIPVLVSTIDKDLSEGTVMQHPQILFYCQAGRLLNPSTFAGWFGRSLFHAIVAFVISIHVYAYEKSEMEEVSMVALSGCIWLQAFVVALETNSFTVFQHLAIWGNLVAFYIINWIFSAIPSSGMYTIMFRLCSQPSYWITMFLIVAAGMGPIVALKYFRYTYRASKINILQQAERMGGPILSLGTIEPQPRAIEKDVAPLSITQPRSRSPVYEPLLSDSPNTRRSFGSGTPFDFFQSPSRLSSIYSRNCKDN
ncbi:phospholipid-transporting ATPase 2 [Citrus sinensis]|uniref:Phospholipid-transporting ATPase 2 n=1 Tax=Citrus sinensis TaxID=2711 RepID=A0ACB8N2I6_CITSI|nr:phospholipid-transporting ATPase 2 [Citrus sinensis]